jgi:hypothetical protein
LDGGATVSLSLQPDYSPRSTMNDEDNSGRRNRGTSPEKNEVDSCNLIKAQVERIHLENTLSLLNGEFDRLAQSFSKSYQHPENKQNLPLEEFLRLSTDGEFPGKFADKGILEIFNLRYEEVYIYAICSEPANERFLKNCEQHEFVPQDGDVYIYWPEASGGWSGGLDAIYRSENGIWKIVEIF